MIAPWGWRMMAVFPCPKLSSHFLSLSISECANGIFHVMKKKKPITIAHTIFEMALMDCSLFSIISFAHCRHSNTHANWNNETNGEPKKNDPKEKLKSINYFNKSMNHLCIFLLCTRTYGTQLKRSRFYPCALALCLSPSLSISRSPFY